MALGAVRGPGCFSRQLSPRLGAGGGLATMSHLTNEEIEPRDHDTGFEPGWLSSEVHGRNLCFLGIDYQELNGALHIGCLRGAQVFSISALWLKYGACIST